MAIGKFNRRQILSNVNTKHTSTKEPLRTRTERGTHVEKDHDRILQMEYEYWEIRWRFGQINDTEEYARILICARCGYEYITKCGIKQHISRVRNELGRASGIWRPYFPSSFSTIGELNIHIYDKICPSKANAIETKSWPDIWNDVCQINKDRYRA